MSLKFMLNIDDLLEGSVGEDIYKRFLNLKSDHKLSLSKFKDTFENIYDKETHLRGEINTKVFFKIIIKFIF